MADFPIAWAKGGSARVVSIGADAIVLVSTIPSPPGSRIDGVIAADATAADAKAPNVNVNVNLKVKIHVSRREADGTFRLEGRPLDMTREVREMLVAMAMTSASPST